MYTYEYIHIYISYIYIYIYIYIYLFLYIYLFFYIYYICNIYIFVHIHICLCGDTTPYEPSCRHIKMITSKRALPIPYIFSTTAALYSVQIALVSPKSHIFSKGPYKNTPKSSPSSSFPPWPAEPTSMQMLPFNFSF